MKKKRRIPPRIVMGFMNFQSVTFLIAQALALLCSVGLVLVLVVTIDTVKEEIDTMGNIEQFLVRMIDSNKILGGLLVLVIMLAALAMFVVPTIIMTKQGFRAMRDTSDSDDELENSRVMTKSSKQILNCSVIMLFVSLLLMLYNTKFSIAMFIIVLTQWVIPSAYLFKSQTAKSFELASQNKTDAMENIS